VLASAFLHASWNLLAKRARGGTGFLYLFSLLTVAVYGPVALVYVLVVRPQFTLAHLGFALGSSIIHVGYFVFLQRGYEVGDLSLVYPLARGSGPALATLLAMLLLGERPGVQALAGTAIVIVSVFVLTGGRGLLALERRTAVVYGLVTGLFIGIYTVWDGYAVGVLMAVPLLFTFTGEAGRVLVLAPLMIGKRAEIGSAWREHRLEALGVAVLSPLAYLMVLTAMRFTPISLVAPTREVSILIGALLGTRLLAEGEGNRRLVGAVGMVIGVALLATG
jgi:drug/metabolite transporter (DMT)-like permease